MAHGIKPYGMTEAQETIFGVHDLGEHAARLFSIDTFDRLGNIVWMDDFEAGMSKWVGGFVAPAGFIRMNYTSSRNGLSDVAMQPGVGAGTTAYLEHYNPYNREGGLGLEASFSVCHDSGPIQIRFRAYSTVHSFEVGIRYNPVTDILEYLDSGGGWTRLAPVVVDPGPPIVYDPPYPALNRVFRLFHTCKIVVSTLTGQYLRIMLDNHRYTLRPWPAWDLGAGAAAYVWIQLLEEGGVAAVNYAYWDGVILTQNEP